MVAFAWTMPDTLEQLNDEVVRCRKCARLVRYREEIADGIESCPGSIAELYRGENLGKRLIRLHH